MPNISRKIAQCVTVLAQTAEMLKGQDWVDPDDPMLIAENELLGAAQSIEKAAKKLSTLKPRKEISSQKVNLKVFFFIILSLFRIFMKDTFEDAEEDLKFIVTRYV